MGRKSLKVLVTGITGFAGSHLAEYLLTLDGVEVYGACRWRSRLDNLHDLARAHRLNNIVEVNIASAETLQRVARPNAVNLLHGDITDATSMKRLIESVQPDRVFHLAAQSFVPGSWNAPAETFHINAIGQINLFEAILAAGLKPLVHIAGSSEEYGLVYENETPMKETNPLRPLSPYAVSKVAQEMLAWQYFRSYGLKAVVTRGFNHTGPRRGEVFVTSTVAKQIAEIEKGYRPPILYIGDVECKRDWTDVRDTVRGYWLSLEKGAPGEVYNIGSGTTRTIREMMDILLGMSKVKIEVRQDPARLRPSDVRILWSDVSKFRQQTGWQPTIPFTKTMQDLLDYWREHV
jgi:GDP-4-dehydro-6-deoxy-D-mannose reductase